MESTMATGHVVEALPSPALPSDDAPTKPAVLVTCAAGIRSPGLAALVEALAAVGSCRLFVCAPDSDKSNLGYAITTNETVSASSVEMAGADAFEISGTPVDAVSLVLSGALPSWPIPDLVISGINMGPSCGHAIMHSAATASAYEALLLGVPAIVLSLNWKKEESSESAFKDAADACMQLILAFIGDAKKNTLFSGCVLNIGIPTSPLVNKGFKATLQGLCRSAQTWQVVSRNKPPAPGTHIMSTHYNLGIQLAQLGRDASAAGAARRLSAQRKNVEYESVGAAGKDDVPEVVHKFFRAELHPVKPEDIDGDDDLCALEHGFICVTPLRYQSAASDPHMLAAASHWLSSVVGEQGSS